MWLCEKWSDTRQDDYNLVDGQEKGAAEESMFVLREATTSSTLVLGSSYDSSCSQDLLTCCG